ncbi:DUF3817 domain-containing protein [Neolewinella antarctica]|uniref:Integral membrane protein n=1 Tax=Neolewinella antarctica TaxID=442734 RepID=A0ABX0XEZ9_9BACT|nr:DUF3817 domain-containing protein [Neolewinella antarctica]NJC27772.1 integral membrane protein [Neolewinella antarctica]
MLANSPTTNFGYFRRLGIIEGVSFLIILGITMPLKYLADTPGPNKVIGMVHGGLFLLYCAGAVYFAWRQKWPVWKLLLLWLAAIIPFGTFVADRKLLEE